MAATQTPNYGWTQPAVGGDPTTWGTELNNDLALIDAQVYANEQASVLVGMIVQWGGGMTPPTNWILCDGSSYPTTGTYAKLFAAIGYAWGGSGANFNVPNLQDVFALGASASANPPASAGGSFSYTISAAQMPVHAHGVSDPEHAHNIYDPEHIHGVGDPTHTHGASQDAHTHGGVGVGISGAGTGSIAGAVGGGNLQMGNSGGASANNVYIAGAGTGIYLGYAATGIGVYASSTNISIQNAGGGAPITVVPTYVAVPYIIRFQ
jgi:microcystin-dependent protein